MTLRQIHKIIVKYNFIIRRNKILDCISYIYDKKITTLHGLYEANYFPEIKEKILLEKHVKAIHCLIQDRISEHDFTYLIENDHISEIRDVLFGMKFPGIEIMLRKHKIEQPLAKIRQEIYGK